MTENQLADALKNSTVSRIKPGKHQRVLIIYDVKQSGESMTHPHDRTPPFRAQHANKLLSAVFKARDNMEALAPGDLFLVFDGFKHGNEAEIGRLFKKPDGKVMEKSKRVMFLAYDQASIAQHRGLSRGATVIHQLEFLHCFSEKPVDLGEDTARLHYAGTNKGDVISGVVVPEDGWMMSFEDKKRCYGSHRCSACLRLQSGPSTSVSESS